MNRVDTRPISPTRQRGNPHVTEAEWLACVDPAPLLEHLNETDPVPRSRPFLEALRQAPEVKDLRKSLRFGIECCRRIRHLLHETPLGKIIEKGETYLAGTATWQTVTDVFDSLLWRDGSATWAAARAVCEHLIRLDLVSVARDAALALGYEVAYRDGRESSWMVDRPAVVRAEKSVQAALVRDIFGNPFRPSPVQITGVSSQHRLIRVMAETIYAEQTFADLPILADALEEAGCDNADILAHCRGDGPHARGCWVVDLLLGNE